MDDDPGDEEMERRAAPLGVHGVEEPAERVPADEERERLVLVRRPARQARQEERPEPGGARGDPERPPALDEHGPQVEGEVAVVVAKTGGIPHWERGPGN